MSTCQISITTCYIERVLSCQVITVNGENLKLTFKTVRKSVSWMAHNLGHVFMLRWHLKKIDVVRWSYTLRESVAGSIFGRDTEIRIHNTNILMPNDRYHGLLFFLNLKLLISRLLNSYGVFKLFPNLT